MMFRAAPSAQILKQSQSKLQVESALGDQQLKSVLEERKDPDRGPWTKAILWDVEQYIETQQPRYRRIS